MASEPRDFASLTPALLARKGGARPAMRRPDGGRLFGQRGEALAEDLGWNDFGDDAVAIVPQAAADPAARSVEPAAPHGEPAMAVDPAGQEPAAREATGIPEVLRQIERIAGRLVRGAAPRPAPRAAPQGRRAAFTLRLDADRHFRLRMAGVVLGRSSQDIVTEALDRYLSEVRETEPSVPDVR